MKHNGLIKLRRDGFYHWEYCVTEPGSLEASISASVDDVRLERLDDAKAILIVELGYDLARVFLRDMLGVPERLVQRTSRRFVAFDALNDSGDGSWRATIDAADIAAVVDAGAVRSVWVRGLPDALNTREPGATFHRAVGYVPPGGGAENGER